MALLFPANVSQHSLRFTCLPLGVVQTFLRLADVHFVQTALRILDGADGEVQPLARLAEPFKFGIFGRHGSKPNRTHLCNLTTQFSLGNRAERLE